MISQADLADHPSSGGCEVAGAVLTILVDRLDDWSAPARFRLGTEA